MLDDITDDPSLAAVFDFVDEYLRDVERGRSHPLAHYLARYPAHQDRIAREYLALKHPAPVQSPIIAPADEKSGRADGPDRPDRIGPYRLVRELGRGGQGAVFLAEDSRIARRVALKILPERFESQSAERRRRFQREADVIARLEHPGICGIYDADFERAMPYIAMRYVEGATMAQLIADAKERSERYRAAAAESDRTNANAPSDIGHIPPLPQRPPDVRRVLHLFERAARALHAAHEAGIVHRDVKPGNIIVAGDGAPVILDFGLARDEQSEVADLTQSDEVFGTPAYMSPEQLRDSSEHLDRRTDVYSLGVVMYEVLTLNRPFDAPKRLALFQAIENEPMPDPRDFNPALGEDVKVVLETAMEKDRARRYPTALELAEDLRRIREYEPIRARPASVALRFARWTRRHPALAVSIIGTIVALSAGLAMSQWALAREQRALRFALEKQLAERSVRLIPDDPSCALALGIEAAELAQLSGTTTNYLTRMALLSALDACYLRHELDNDPSRSVKAAENAAAPNVTAMAVSPDTRTLAVALLTGSANLWDIESGRLLASLSGDGAALSSIAYSPDGKWLATGSAEGRVEIWQLDSRASIQRFELGAPIASLEFSRDGARALAATKHGRVHVLDAGDWRESFVLDSGEEIAPLARFAPDGSRIVTAHVSSDRATLWDGRDGHRLLDLIGHTGAIVACEFGPDASEHILVTASRDGSVRLWSSETGEAICAPLVFDGEVQLAVFSPEGRRLAIAELGEIESQCTLVDLVSQERLVIPGHEGRRIVHAAFNPDGTRLATVAANDTTVRVWDARTGAQELRLDSAYRWLTVKWAIDGRRLVTRSNGCVAHVWYAVGRPDTFDLKGHTQAVRTVAFSPDGSRALTASDDGTARLWSVASEGEREPGRLLRAYEHPDPVRFACFSADGRARLTVAGAMVRVWSSPELDAPCVELDHPASVKHASFDADGAQVVSVCEDGRARIWRSDGRSPPIVLDESDATITCARFSPSARLVAAGFTDDRVCVWNVESGDVVANLEFASASKGRRGVADIDWHPRSEEIAVACADVRVRFWNARTGRESRETELVMADPQRVLFDPSGERLLVRGKRSGTAVVLDLATKTRSQNENMHEPPIITVDAFSADGRLVLSGSRDCTLYVWDAQTGRPLVQRVGSRSPVVSAAFNIDGSSLRVIAGREDGTVSIWPVDPLPAAKARKPRELTALERRREAKLAEPLEYE